MTMTVEELVSKLDFELIKTFHDIIMSVEWTQENVDVDLDKTEEFLYQSDRVFPAVMREPTKELFLEIGSYEALMGIWYEAAQRWMGNPQNKAPAPHSTIPRNVAS